MLFSAPESPLDLLHLEHFLAVVDEGTFTRAAERMNRTQPAISQSVRRLEEEVGAPLFAFEQDIEDMFYGARQFCIRDPFGYEIYFIQEKHP